ncbi:hypothetical protein BDV59DRAFT_197983 [Aspergillus ambiguus]|uniref:uncharacterized protein n=1 Tax=Aspergillus ambiguus TaxID=176160 RepID=UPI003CCCC044
MGSLFSRITDWQASLEHPQLPPASTPAIPTDLDTNEMHNYERRLRHKPKPDRYEYKQPVLPQPTKSRKTPSRIRRRLVNDDFHAANVPTERLTLRSRKTPGIFSKGKASSPVRSSLKALLRPFSEVDFLSISHHHHAEKPRANPHNQDKDEPTGPHPKVTPSTSLLHKDLHQTSSTKPNHHEESDKHDGDETDQTETAKSSSEVYHCVDTGHLLVYNLDTPPPPTDNVDKYTTLGELKELLQERMKAWGEKTEDIVEPAEPVQGPVCRKRMRSPPVDIGPDSGHRCKKPRLSKHTPAESVVELVHVPSYESKLYSPKASLGSLPARPQDELEKPDTVPGPEKLIQDNLLLDHTEDVCIPTFLAAYKSIMHDDDRSETLLSNNYLDSHSWETHKPTDNSFEEYWSTQLSNLLHDQQSDIDAPGFETDPETSDPFFRQYQAADPWHTYGQEDIHDNLKGFWRKNALYW